MRRARPSATRCGPDCGNLQSTRIELPLYIGGREVRTGWFEEAIEPHDHRRVLALAHLADAGQMTMAVEAARQAAPDWSRMSSQSRAAIFLRAAELAAGPWRAPSGRRDQSDPPCWTPPHVTSSRPSRTPPSLGPTSGCISFRARSPTAPFPAHQSIGPPAGPGESLGNGVSDIAVGTPLRGLSFAS